ncbi:Mitogen-activated protein kinase 1 [Choanephora cucurbitarum]|uniref:Mitogen-activated protein kinase n=1 Tax=Choanephora cucurbitarum TaxID=101091 RepID=A0A1C7NKG2_9FUNG|nr:Mitogen-activated protein kinase 1 [Choanephora cucurbitarum]
MIGQTDFYTIELENGSERFTIQKKYKIIRKIGSGSYGSVCSAVNTDTNEVVAIKKCRHVFDKKLITKRCLREMKLLQHFNGHPRIIDLKAMDIVHPQTFNEVYLIQSCCDTTMADIIHSKLILEPVHYQWFIYQLFSGLKYIHSANVLHRDLKPANILVNENCDLRICDFGMARGFSRSSLGHIESQHMTHYVVTRWYRAPEIMLSHHGYDKSIDMWSVGCIFAELLGRKVLFKGTDYVDQLHKIVGILGLPRDTSFWDSSSSVTEYIRSLRDENGLPPPENPIDFHLLFPNTPPEAIHLLQELLHLDPSKRISASQGLEHPFVAAVRDTSEEVDCPNLFDFESFEPIESEHVLRQCIVEEVMRHKGIQDLDSLHPQHINPSQGSRSSSRKYTGSYISTPSSALAAECNSNAIQLAQQGKDILNDNHHHGFNFLVMDVDRLVGEPEDMSEDDMRMMNSDESDIHVGDRRTLLGPSNADFDALERHLSRDW